MTAPYARSHSDIPPTPITDPSDPESHMCIFCWEDVPATSTLWVTTHCEPHNHILHTTCLARWWYESGRRRCCRCTEHVRAFTVYARHPSNDTPHFRTFESIELLWDHLGSRHGIVAQSPQLIPLMDGRNIENFYPSIFAALATWCRTRWKGADADETSPVAIEGHRMSDEVIELCGKFFEALDDYTNSGDNLERAMLAFWHRLEEERRREEELLSKKEEEEQRCRKPSDQSDSIRRLGRPEFLR